MSSKKFRGKPCAYCGEPASSPDHVVARKFFLPEDRGDLPQVPACAPCNAQKSVLETELLALLPFGGRNERSRLNLQTMVPPRLKKNHRLHRRLSEGQRTIWAEHEGLVIPTMILPIDGERLIELFKWITRGLLWFHWQVRLTDAHDVIVLPLTLAGEEIFDRQFALNAAQRVLRDLKNGTFWYESAQAGDDPTVTIWRFSVLGGVRLGDPDAPGEFASRIGVMTGPGTIRQGAARAVMFGVRKV